MAIFSSVLSTAGNAASGLLTSAKEAITSKSNLKGVAQVGLGVLKDKGGIAGKAASSLAKKLGKESTADPKAPKTFTYLSTTQGSRENTDPFYQCYIYQKNSWEAGKPPTEVRLWLQDQVAFNTSSEWDQPFKDGPLNNTGGVAGAVLKAARVAGIVPITRFQLIKVWSGVADFSITLTFSLIAENSYEDDILTPLLNLMKMQSPSQPKGAAFVRPPGPHVVLHDGEAFVKAIADSGKELAMAAGTGALGAVSELAASGLNIIPGVDNSINAVNGFAQDQFKAATEHLKQSSNALSNATTAFGIENAISIEVGNFMRFDSVYIESVSPAFNIVLGPNGKPMRCNIEITFSPFITPMLEDYEYIFHKTEKRG